MNKIAGSTKYPFGAGSPSDPRQVGLGFNTREDAQKHADSMNKLLQEFETNPIWDKNYWKKQPEPWVVFELQ